MIKFLIGLLMISSVSALACMEIAQKFKPFGDNYLTEHTFKIYSGGLKIDNNLLYFNSEKERWTIVNEKGVVQEFEPNISSLTLSDDRTGKTTGTISLGNPTMDTESGKKVALATLTPSPSEGAKSQPPKLYFESMTFDLKNNPSWGLGQQKVSISNNAGAVLSTLAVTKTENYRSLVPEKKQDSDNVLDISKAGGHYRGNGCGTIAPVQLSSEERLRLFQKKPGIH